MKNIYINIITPYTSDLFMKQLPKSLEKEGFVFFENSSLDYIWDIVVVYDSLTDSQTLKCKKGGLIFISGEPPLSSKYASEFLNQFDHLITSHSKISHPNNHLTQQALPWHFGLNFQTNKFKFSYDDLINLPVPKKINKISFITSNKTALPGHNQRLKFLKAIKNKFGDQVDVFGKGINPIDDKADALLSYQFCICIENSSINDYWTEKIADPLLSYTIPIYYGCKNINKYFNESSLIVIDINDLVGSLKVVENVLLYSTEIYLDKIQQLKIERNKLLNEYNIFNVLINFFDENIKNNNNYSRTEIEVLLNPSKSYKEHQLKMNLLNLKRFIYRLPYKLFRF